MKGRDRRRRAVAKKRTVVVIPAATIRYASAEAVCMCGVCSACEKADYHKCQVCGELITAGLCGTAQGIHPDSCAGCGYFKS